MNIYEAQTLIKSNFTYELRNAFYQAIKGGFDKYNRIRETNDYKSLGEYAKNDKRRLLYSSVCSCLDSPLIKSNGFQTSTENFTSSYKTRIYNENIMIDVFDSKHNNSRQFQDSRFKMNDADGQKYIIIVYYGDRDSGVLERIMIRIFNGEKKLVYEEDLI